MKAIAVTLFMVLTVVTTSVASRVMNQGDPVIDYNGNPVKPNKPYFIQVANDPENGVARDKRTTTSSCPQAAVLSSSPKAVVFLPQSTELNHHLSTSNILVDSPISIRFKDQDPCPEAGIWKVDNDSPFPKSDIPVNGFASKAYSTFTIQKSGQYYKFVYQSVDIGVSTAPGTAIEHLVIFDKNPLEVIFVPETSSFLKTTVPLM